MIKKSTVQVLKLFFNPNEEICISHNKYGYHSVKQSDLISDITLISPKEDMDDVIITEKDINMLTINPVKGFRQDKNVTAYRSFLIELDDGSLPEQKKYVQDMGMPYSICIFSGNKSLHYGIVLDQDLPDYNTYKFYIQWILNIMKKADPLTKNPSRNIRFPNNRRNNGKRLVQKLIDIKDRVELNELVNWLNKFPECEPNILKVKSKIKNKIVSPLDIPPYILEQLHDGVYDNRNNTWFKIAAKLSQYMPNEDQLIDFLDQFFTEEPDFPRWEFISAVKNGIKANDKDVS